jgi:hypothetical protein
MNPMKKILFILFISLAIAQDLNADFLKSELNRAIDDINSKKFSSAISRIDNNDFSQSIFSNHALILKMKALHGNGDIENALLVRKSINLNNLESNLNTIYSIEMGDIFSEMGFFDKSFEYYLIANKNNIDSKSNKRINQRIKRMVRMELDEQHIGSLLLTEDDPININILRLAQSFSMARNNSNNLKDVFASIDYNLLPRDLRSSHRYLNKNISNNNSFGLKMGVVLPLSGENATQAKAFLSGLKEGNDLSNNTNKIQFIVVDNYGEQLNTVRACNDLVNFHKVDGIIGPFSDENLISAATALSNSDIPIFAPNSNNESIHSINKNVYLLDSSLDTKSEVLADHVVNNLNLEKVAIIAPRTEEGIEEVDSFLKEMDKLNKEPVSIQWYENTDPIDLRELFQNLREVAWEINAQDEYQEFLGVDINVLDSMFDVDAEEVYDIFNIEEDDSIDSTKVILESIDGIFFPLAGEGLTYVATQVSLSNLQTQLLGNDLWLDIDFINQENISPHISGMYFVSSFKPNYRIGNQFDYDHKLNNLFHYGLDFAQFIIDIETTNNNFFFFNSNEPNQTSNTRSFDFSKGMINSSVNILQYSKKRIIKTNIAKE